MTGPGLPGCCPRLGVVAPRIAPALAQIPAHGVLRITVAAVTDLALAAAVGKVQDLVRDRLAARRLVLDCVALFDLFPSGNRQGSAPRPRHCDAPRLRIVVVLQPTTAVVRVRPVTTIWTRYTQ